MRQNPLISRRHLWHVACLAIRNSTMAAAARLAVMLVLLALLPAPAFAVTVTITNPPEGATLTGTLTVDISASSPSGFDVTLDGRLWATNLCCRSTLSVEWKTGLGDNGPPLAVAAVEH